jgi:hypothetical protein
MHLSSLNADLAAKLDRLETGTAVLEQDARNRRTVLVELGLASPAARARIFGWAAAQSKWLTIFGVTRDAAIGSLAWLERTLRSPHVATAFRVMRSWLRDGAVYLSLACAALIPFVLGVLLLAPPE